MQTFQFLKDQFLTLDIEINQHHLNRYIKFMISLPIIDKKDGYGESHHILPASLFPQFKLISKARWNQKRINERAHFLSHWMLSLAFRNNKAMAYAFWSMANQKVGGRTTKLNSRGYSIAKTEFSKIKGENHQRYGSIGPMKGRKGVNHPAYGIRGSLHACYGKKWNGAKESHHSYNRKPWEALRSSEETIKVWSLASEIKKIYVPRATGPNRTGGLKQISEIFNIKYGKSLQNLTTKIREGWVPEEDQDWVNFFAKYNDRITHK